MVCLRYAPAMPVRALPFDICRYRGGCIPPGRSAHMAVAEMETGWKEGRRHAVECDLKAFFDTVNHDRLMRALLGKVRCRKTLGLI